MINQELIEDLESLIETAESMKNAYFWKPPVSASGRRYYEKRYSHALITWTEGGDEYTASYDVECSCRNIYARGYYTRNGSKTTLTAIRNSYTRLKLEYDSNM